MKRFLLLTLMLTMVAPALVQAAVANAKTEVKSAVHYHDHSSHQTQSDGDREFNSDGRDVYLTTSSTLVSSPDRTLEKVDFSCSKVLLSIFSIDLLSLKARGPPSWTGWKDDALRRQFSLILTTQRFRI